MTPKHQPATPLTDAFYKDRFKDPDAIDFARKLEQDRSKLVEALRGAVSDIVYLRPVFPEDSDHGRRWKAYYSILRKLGEA